MKAILAVNKLNFIGEKGILPWYSPDDLKHFKELTSQGSKAVIVGFRTAETLPPLKDRIIHVIDRNNDPEWESNLKVFMLKYPDAWIIGGKSTYELMKDSITEYHISRIDDFTYGDTSIPELNPSATVVEYYFKGVSNKRYLEKLLLTARRKSEDVMIISLNSEDVKKDHQQSTFIHFHSEDVTSHLGLEPNKESIYNLDLDKPLFLQEKRTREKIYNFLFN